MRQKTLDKYHSKPRDKYQKYAGFAAMIEDLDSGVGLLLERLKVLGLEENTYVIYTSDNGVVPIMPLKSKYNIGSIFPLSPGKWDAKEGGIRVPFIIAGPQVFAGLDSKALITHLDLLPTIIDLAGLKLPLKEDIDGGSFKEILANKGKGNVSRFSEGLIFHVPYKNWVALKRAHSAIIIDDFKLIKFYGNGELMLFNLNEDLEEKNNLVLSLPNKANTLEKALDTYLSKVKASKWKPGINWKNKPIEKINSYH